MGRARRQSQREDRGDQLTGLTFANLLMRGQDRIEGPERNTECWSERLECQAVSLTEIKKTGRNKVWEKIID